MILLTYPQGSPDWLQARVGVCTASRFSDACEISGGLTEQQQKFVDAIQSGTSEASALRIAGYQKRPTAASVEKALAGMPVGEPGAKAIKYAWTIAMETIAREPLDDTFVTYAMNRGRELEPRARAVYEQRTQCWIEEVSLILTDDSFYGYSADGFRDDDGLIEIKCPLSCEKLGQVWASPETAHLEYIDQINGGLWITGRKYCDLVVYCPWLSPVGKDLFVKRIYRDEEAIERLEAGLVAFRKIVDGFLEVLRAPARMSGKPKEVANPAPPWDAAPAAPTGALAPVALPENLFA